MHVMKLNQHRGEARDELQAASRAMTEEQEHSYIEDENYSNPENYVAHTEARGNQWAQFLEQKEQEEEEEEEEDPRFVMVPPTQKRGRKQKGDAGGGGDVSYKKRRSTNEFSKPIIGVQEDKQGFDEMNHRVNTTESPRPVNTGKMQRWNPESQRVDNYSAYSQKKFPSVTMEHAPSTGTNTLARQPMQAVQAPTLHTKKKASMWDTFVEEPEEQDDVEDEFVLGEGGIGGWLSEKPRTESMPAVAPPERKAASMWDTFIEQPEPDANDEE